MNRTTLARSSIILALTAMSSLAQDAVDLWIGAAGSRLAWSPRGVMPGSAYFPLVRVDNEVFLGWSNDDPGFDHATSSDTIVGVSPLLAEARIWIEVVEVDPALLLVDDQFHILEFPGQRTFLGGPLLHEHFTWYIEEENPGFDPDQCAWSGTFVLKDLGHTHYQDSLPFTMDFTIVPVRAPNGSFDLDNHVDLDDVAPLNECLFGPRLMPGPDDPAITTCAVECFNAFDFDNDRDIDLTDIAGFQRRFGD